MLIKSEKHLLAFIKYSPAIIILIVAVIINILIYFQNEQNFQRDLEIYKKNYIESNQALTKFQVEKIYKDILRERESLELKLENELKQKVNEAFQIVGSLHKKYNHLPKDKLLTLIKESLRDIRFNENRGYFFINTLDGINILHPIKPSFENSDITNIKNLDGEYIFKNILTHFKTNNEYLGYVKATKPDNLKKEYEKLTYQKLYKPLNLIIGTGEYKDEFIKNIKKHIIKEHIQNVRYGKNGYIFIFDYDGKQLAHIKEDYIGENRIDLVDSNGFKITQGIINQAKKEPGYISYIGSIMPQTGEPAYKTTYVRGFDHWGWAIGSGFYNLDLIIYLENKKEELRNITNESLKTTLLFSFLLTIILLTLAFYISKILKNFFNVYHSKIENQIYENREKDMVLYQQSKMASMGEMLGNIAHQWRQPLSSISTIASGTKIQKELDMLDDKEFNKGMETIVSTTKHLSQTIEDFREFFNPNKIRKEIQTNTIYEKAIQLVSSRLSTKNIELMSTIDNTTIITFENELLQCIMNILNNAIDAFEQSKIEEKVINFSINHQLECKIPNCDIKECSQGKEGYIKITIQDNAGGISKENIDKIFEAYFTTKHKSQGTGIGLYMTYEIINKHLGGYITVENKEIEYNDKNYLGAEFTVILPIKIEEG